MPTPTSDVRQQILAAIHAAGFDAVGIADPATVSQSGERLMTALGQGWHGDMAWLAEKAHWRRDPLALWPDVKSIIVAAINYGPAHDPLDDLKHRDRGVVSVYARGKDYHDILKKRLKAIARNLAAEHSAEVKIFVDTAPVMEKPLAQAAGLGWQGKHTNLVSRDLGSWTFLGAIFTTLELPVDAPMTDHCGGCHRCLDICPTQAFPAPYQLDARRCISYLTIEYKGHIPREFRVPLANRIYGCDDCLAVCPWNKFAKTAREAAFSPRADLTAPRLADLALLDDAAFRTRFAGSPIKRIGRDRFVRNVLIAIGNSGDAALAAAAQDLVSDPSPLVRAMAAWALSRLLPLAEFAALKSRYLSLEADPDVAAEWQ